MRVRRCAILLLEPRERVRFDLASLLDGGDGLHRERAWYAMAPHLEADVRVDADEREWLGRISPGPWVPFESLAEEAPPALLARLLDEGLLLGEGAAHDGHRARDQALRDGHWEPLSALSQMRARWRDADCERGSRALGLARFADMVERLGPPPAHLPAHAESAARIPLARAPDSALGVVLERRITCRNWDHARPLDAQAFATVLHRVHAAHAVHAIAPGASVLKKSSPSGGGLHPTAAYLLVRHVEGVAPGFYHYHAGDHALEPMPWPAALAASLVAGQRAARGESGVPVAAGPDDDATLRDFASALLAGQHWFGGAHVLVFLTCRFRRHTWKYRHHVKALRVCLLDAGHLSQTLYLCAAEAGLGAFVTAAVNDVEIEQALGIDPLEEGVMAVNGFGWRGARRETVEFDPLRTVWPDWGGVERDGPGQ